MSQKDSRNVAILFGLLLKAQAMTPLSLLFGTQAFGEDFLALLISLVLAFILSAFERAMPIWKMVVWSACSTSAACGIELLWLRHIEKLGPPISRYGIVPTVLFVGVLYLVMGGLIGLLDWKSGHANGRKF